MRDLAIIFRPPSIPWAFLGVAAQRASLRRASYYAIKMRPIE
jgi:hypothetical protein